MNAHTVIKVHPIHFDNNNNNQINNNNRFRFQKAEIKKAAKEGNNDACTILAKQLVQLRKQKTRTIAANSKITSVGFQNKTMGANIALSGAMATTSQTMNQMNKIMQPEKIAGDMRAFQQANMKMEMTDEMSE